jgi:hypothetical protein
MGLQKADEYGAFTHQLNLMLAQDRIEHGRLHLEDCVRLREQSDGIGHDRSPGSLVGTIRKKCTLSGSGFEQDLRSRLSQQANSIRDHGHPILTDYDLFGDPDFHAILPRTNLCLVVQPFQA